MGACKLFHDNGLENDASGSLKCKEDEGGHQTYIFVPLDMIYFISQVL